MTANTSPIFVANVTGKGTTWTNSDAASTKKTISPTIGANGARVNKISICTDDTTAREFQLFLNDGTTDFLVGTVSVPIGSGNTAAVAAVSVTSAAGLTWIGSDGSFFVPPSWVVKMMNLTQPTSGKTFTVVMSAGDY